MASGHRTKKFIGKTPVKAHDPHGVAKGVGAKTEKTVMPACWGLSGSAELYDRLGGGKS